ncbi:MAG: L,D-transpeptidase family protein [Acidimicrobiia bacterium]
MRRTALLVGIVLTLAACGLAPSPDAGPTTPPAPMSTTPVGPPSTTTPLAPIAAVADSRPRPVETALATRATPDLDALPDGATLVARANGSLQVYAIAGGTRPTRTLGPETILGTETVVDVVDGPRDGWARVMLPGRPNGSRGWVRAEDVTFYTVPGRLVIDLSDRELTYYEGDQALLETPVAVGTDRNPTPIGAFFVTDKVTLEDPGGPWGPAALGLSARSDTITEYNGGDGIIGIHGTSRPGSIGRAASLGCVRLPNDVITVLHEIVPLGTPVEIRP